MDRRELLQLGAATLAATSLPKLALAQSATGWKNHLDAYNLLPYLTGQEKKSPRNFFMYLSDDGDVLGLRFDNWKVCFMEQRARGTLQVWAEPFTRLVAEDSGEPETRSGGLAAVTVPLKPRAAKAVVFELVTESVEALSVCSVITPP